MQRAAFPIRVLARKAGRVMLILIAIVLAGILILLALLLAWSPGKPEPFLAENGQPLFF